jgi:hypothetical protein
VPHPSDHPLVERHVVVDQTPAAVGGRPARRKFDAAIVERIDRAARSVTQLVEPRAHLRRGRVAFVSITEDVETSTPAGEFIVHIMATTEVASCFAEWAEHPVPSEARLRQQRATAFVSRRPRRGEDRKAFASGHKGHGYTHADLSASRPERPRTCLSPDRLGPRNARRMKPTW